MTDYDKIETIKGIIEELLAKGGIPGQVEFEDSITQGLVFNIASPDSYLLIGRQGSHLHSLQIIVQALAARRLRSQEPLRFTIDVDDYKRKREWFLKETAKGAVEHMKRTGRPVSLEPMPNYERKFIHAYLQEHYPDVASESQGQEPRRKIVIRTKR
ncbi:MAG TPA: R3H domain-containing nucleic acid-binding protein [Patescibacteria group bacterium]|nr:R3H domain-containing nucleic acid-binding protein [Patescibacteria group bacterium]